MKSPTQAFVDFYVNHIEKKAMRRREVIRTLQEEAHRTAGRVVRVYVWEDLPTREAAPQNVFAYTYKVVHGEAVRLPNATPANVTVMTDAPTVHGIGKGRYVRLFRGQRPYVREPFTPLEAVAMGLIKWTGEAGALKDFYLLVRKVWPLIEEDLHV